MNVKVQICGLLILTLLFIFYKTHKTLQLYKERVFCCVFTIIGISLSLDVLSLVALHHRELISELLLLFICKTYIVFLIWGSLSTLIYVLTDVYPEKKHRKLTHKLVIATVIQCLTVYALPIYYEVTEHSAYTYGPSVMAVYLFTFINIVAIVVTAQYFSKMINPRRRFAVNLWMVIWIISAVIQFLNSEWLIVGFASVMGVMILFGIIENPEANLDRKLGCFNSYALTEYYKQLVERDIDFGILEISFEDSGMIEEYGMDAQTVMLKILSLLKPYSNLLIFKNINLGLIIVSRDIDELQTAGEAVLEGFAEYEEFREEAMLILASQPKRLTDMNELMQFLSYVHVECEERTGEVIVVTDEIRARYLQHQLIQKEIDEALAENRVEVFLQPIYSNQERCFASAEALVRIRRRDGSLLSPGVFIPIAEESGQILQLGERVFELVCAFLKKSDVREYGIKYIEVNLSVVQCEKKDLAQKLLAITKKYDVEPKWFNLEITEFASIQTGNVLLENIKILMEQGFSFSLDDFGKGESNLMYIVQMPVSIVKLDYDMSKAFFTSAKAKHVVKAVVGMAHDMNLKLVAEGIETQEEIDGMKEVGVDYIQGFYYSKPLPMDEFQEFIHSATGKVH